MRRWDARRLYYFAHRYPAQEALHLEAFHASELPYGFGRIGAEEGWPPLWPRPPDDQRERALSAAIMNYFASFARTGRPEVRGLAPWRRYRAPPVSGDDKPPDFGGRNALLRSAVRRLTVTSSASARRDSWAQPHRNREFVLRGEAKSSRSTQAACQKMQKPRRSPERGGFQSPINKRATFAERLAHTSMSAIGERLGHFGYPDMLARALFAASVA
ncbi:MAG: carboxylesterase family protein [Steroidobacteraceae bacterium]